ncbi:MAG: wax ester/triacylglycerol synthase family O-acyltransferase, partial [Pseudomonadota bacterium]
MAKRLGDLIREWSPEQLTGLDALFAYAETPRTPMHIGDCKIYDPSTAPGGKVRFKDILRHVEERVHRAKTFRQKLKQVPLGYDHPYWIDDPDFDIEFHIRHIALPHPGDWRQLCIQIARLHARSLDMSKPLWEFTVIEGLENIPNVPKGAYAIVAKVHHCAIDGASGVDIAHAIHSLSPEEEVEESEPWTPGRSPGVVEMVTRANINNATKPFHALRVARRMAPGAWKFASGITSGEMKLLGAKIPRTRFNGVVSGHRVVEGVTFGLDDIKTIRKRIPGATVNDVVLAIVGGGLRHYLSAKDELPHDSLIAMAPVSVRTKDEKNKLGNQVTALSIPLGTHVSDPLARLHFTHDAAANQKAMSKAVGARELSEASKLAPAMVSGISTRLYSRLGLANRISPMFNTVVTNVPGPQTPLYMAGAKLVSAYGIGPVMDSMGLFHAVTSYCGDVAITVTGCREMLPDPHFYRECLEKSFEELHQAAKKPRSSKNKKQDSETGDVISANQNEQSSEETDQDDFTLIKGIGAPLADKLRAAGLYTFEQIASLTTQEADDLDRDLELDGQITNDGWVAQAAALVAA